MNTRKQTLYLWEGNTMDLKLTDPEANAVKHALESYLKVLQSSDQKSGIRHEEEALESVIKKIQSMPGAPGT
jgi:hypothetical protein